MTQSTTTLPRPADGVNLMSHPNEAPWQDDGDGFLYKPLFEDPAAKMKTWLMRVEPGAEAPLHAHEELEQVYVIEGEFYDSEHTYGPGDFVVRAPGAMHTGGSHNGATVLLVYTA